MKNLMWLMGLSCTPLVLDFKGKLAILLFIGLLSQVQAGNYPDNTKISLHLQDVTVEKVLKEIESHSEFKFLYNDKEVNHKRNVSVHFIEENIFRILHELFSGTDIIFEVFDRQIILKTDASKLGAGGNGSPAQGRFIFQRTISGKVVDDSNQPLPGVSIQVEGTVTGTISDFDGNYSIAINSESAVLIFTFIGMKPIKSVVGGSNVMNVQMEPDTQTLDEIVVTALGIKKDARKLGYAVSKVDADEINLNRTTNFMDALQGKVAGVNISTLGTGPGGSSKVRIRGQSSISGTNNPLIVVNGVPIDNTSFGTNPGSTGGEPGTSSGGVTSDGGDGFSSINPDDIESMTILKGATGAALYGSRAKDGVIMITTKSRKDGNGIGVTYNLSIMNHIPLDFTDYQYEYGQGENGIRPTSANPTSGQWSFGEKFQPGMTQILFDGIEVPYIPQYNNIRKFYRDGLDVTNSVSLSGGNEKGGFNLSFADLKSDGITPNNEFNRRTVSFSLAHNFTEKLSVDAHVNYSNEKNTNPPNVAQQDNTIPVALFNMANSMPLELLDGNKFDADGNEFIWSRFKNRTNPYFTLSEQFNNIVRDRLFGNVALKYNIFPWLFVQGRIGQDYWSRDQEYNGFPTGQASLSPAPEGFVNGTYTQEQRRFREINMDFLVSASKEFGDLGVDVNVGGNRMKRKSELNHVNVTDFVVRNLYTVQNGRVKNPTYDMSERAVNSLYGSLDLSFKQTLYLTGTLRNDWFSTLSKDNRSILYPSISGSYVFSNNLKQDWLTFAKIRVAYAEVGSDTDVAPYSDQLFYNINSNLFANPTGAMQPVASAATSTLPNPNLRPMRSKDLEFGLDLRMLEGRVGLDIAWYRKTTLDQIIAAQTSNTSGYVSTLINSGESRSDGLEVTLNLIPVRTVDFQWDANLNVSYNTTEVISLLTDEPGDRILVGNHVFNGYLYQVVGMEIGQLAGFGYRYDEQGRQIFGDNGRPLRSEDIKYFGSALPKYFGGITNNFRYKDFNLSFFVDFKLGGKMISGTNFNAVRHGLHKMTLEGRENGVVGVGVNQEGQPNTVVSDVQPYWEIVRSQALIEPIVYDSGYWKLRQISLGYNFRQFIPEDSFIKEATLSLLANNVWMIKKWVPNIDPDSFGFSSDNVSGLESTGVPTTRGLGLNLNLKF